MNFLLRIAALILVLVSTNGTAAIVTYEFDDGGAGLTFLNSVPPGGNISDGVSAIDPNIIGASAWTVSNSTQTVNQTIFSLAGFGSPNRGQAAAGRNWLTGNSFEFFLTVRPGYALDLTQFSFNEQGSNGAQGLGPTSWEFYIDDGLVANGSATRGQPGGMHSGALSLTSLTGNVFFSIRAANADVDNATWRVDDFTLDGTVSAVPLPPAALLFITAGALFSTVGRNGKTQEIVHSV